MYSEEVHDLVLILNLPGAGGATGAGAGVVATTTGGGATVVAGSGGAGTTTRLSNGPCGVPVFPETQQCELLFGIKAQYQDELLFLPSSVT